MTELARLDDAIRVVATPSQASYFAGEPFSVTITFTNTRSPECNPPRSASHSAATTHKRSAHSISSVPMARPPTSPGTPRAPLPAVPTRHAGPSTVATRRGLIGRNSALLDDESGSIDPSRKRLSTKSLSISITTPHDSEGQTLKGKSPIHSLRANDSSYASPTSPRISSPLARSAPLPMNHPHARKQSVMDGQLQLQELRPPASVSPSPFPPTPSASTSSFSLSLDPIAEGGASPVPPMTPSLASPIPETSAANLRTQIPWAGTAANVGGSQAHLPAAGRPPVRRPQQLGHGPPPGGTQAQTQPPRSAFSSSFPVPNTELILYSYAQLTGTLAISPPAGAPVTPEQARALNHLRASLLKRRVVGGGSMDITPVLSSQPFGQGQQQPLVRRSSHGRSSSVSGSFFSLLSPTSLMPSSPAPQPFSPSHRARAPSMFSLFSYGAPSGTVGLGLGGVGMDEEFDPDTPLPTFEVQPSMLAVDLALAPGESRSYTYSITLPENLPPTYKGRSMRFSYEFILGICRAAPSPPGSRGPTGANSSSRVMKVPIRLYNNVVVGRPPKPYDLLWPTSSWRTRGVQFPAKVVEEPRPELMKLERTPPPGAPAPNSGTFEGLQEYARNLLASLHDPNTTGARIKLPIEAINLERDREQEEAGGLSGCRQAVEILTRNPKKASYDVNKDGVKVAVLTFTKSAYRLGETVLGVVELNERSSRARVLKLSAILEAHESLPSSIASPTNSRHMRRVHAEHHSSFVPSTLRTTFSLDIPPDASPAFQVDVSGDARGSPRGPGGLEWKVRLCLLVAVASPNTREGPDGLRLRHLVKDGPKGEWGASWKAARSIAPMERPDLRAQSDPGDGEQIPASPGTARSWLSFFAAPLMGPATGYHDGDEDAEDSDDGGTGAEGSEEDWRDVKAEMVECEVPIKVWPGNTAFKATEVVFDV
ncbi:hypothetical protein AcV5_004100 [Taiwanofungus camphoratus]|nr:hypothetical protein AcV5_004100 [Antrodia cinnamomea]